MKEVGALATSWFESAQDTLPFEPAAAELAFVRLWRGFMTARVMIALVLLNVQGFAFLIGQSNNRWLLVLTLAYLTAALAVRLFASPRAPGGPFDPQWVSSIGIDLITFSSLQFLQAGLINYTPLFALPVLLASVLGSSLLALGTAAGVTLLQLAEVWWQQWQTPGDAPSQFLQAGLWGVGFFALAIMISQLSARLAREEGRARRSTLAARTQAQVSALVIETLTDGVLVIDVHGVVRAANPAALQLLGPKASARPAPFALGDEMDWAPLAELAKMTFSAQLGQMADLTLAVADDGAFTARARTRLTMTDAPGDATLCVMFLQDLREMEARVRTEKLAAMGRISAAVAHEIRNPLAAIVQANALLEEDLRDPAQRQLSQLVQHNAQRLSRMVEDVLDVSRAQAAQRHAPDAPSWIDLTDATQRICAEWSAQKQPAPGRLQLDLVPVGGPTRFDEEHLRRVLFNLLDNAARHADKGPGAIRVHCASEHTGAASLTVWSHGPRIEKTVQSHLFEPFFSSSSRSSGLGLYICRELCLRHGATISYRREERDGLPGNAFAVDFAAPPPEAARRGGPTEN